MESVFTEEALKQRDFVETLSKTYRQKSITLMLLRKELEFYQQLTIEFAHMQEMLEANQHLQGEADQLELFKQKNVTALQNEMMQAHRNLKMGLNLETEAKELFEELMLRFQVVQTKAALVKDRIQTVVSVN